MEGVQVRLSTAPRVLEIVNMSDHYTMVCEDDTIAEAAVILLGEGAYGLTDVASGESVAPILLFCSGAAADFEARHGTSLDEALGRKAELAAALETVVVGNRSNYDAALAHIETEEAQQRFREDWHDRHRTSMNDIGSRARRMAAAFREQAP